MNDWYVHVACKSNKEYDQNAEAEIFKAYFSLKVSSTQTFMQKCPYCENEVELSVTPKNNLSYEQCEDRFRKKIKIAHLIAILGLILLFVLMLVTSSNVAFVVFFVYVLLYVVFLMVSQRMREFKEYFTSMGIKNEKNELTLHRDGLHQFISDASLLEHKLSWKKVPPKGPVDGIRD